MAGGLDKAIVSATRARGVYCGSETETRRDVARTKVEATDPCPAAAACKGRNERKGGGRWAVTRRLARAQNSRPGDADAGVAADAAERNSCWSCHSFVPWDPPRALRAFEPRAWPLKQARKLLHSAQTAGRARVASARGERLFAFAFALRSVASALRCAVLVFSVRVAVALRCAVG